MRRSASAALDAVKYDDSVSVVVLKATGKAFTTGYDLDGSDWILSQNPIEQRGKLNLDRDREDIKTILEYWWTMWKFPKPIVAQVQGLCLSGGGELIAMCDLVVAAETAKFGHPAGRDLGIPPTVFLWPMLIGMKKTREFLYTARLFSATEAERLGLINRVVPLHELEKNGRRPGCRCGQNAGRQPRYSQAGHQPLLRKHGSVRLRRPGR